MVVQAVMVVLASVDPGIDVEVVVRAGALSPVVVASAAAAEVEAEEERVSAHMGSCMYSEHLVPIQEGCRMV